MMEASYLITMISLKIYIILQVLMWLPRYGTSRVLKTHIQIIFKPKLFPFLRTTHQTYTLSNSLPHLESTNSLSTDFMSHTKFPYQIYNNIPIWIKNGYNANNILFGMRNPKCSSLGSIIQTSAEPSNLDVHKIIQTGSSPRLPLFIQAISFE